jgi:hypothetical protein
MARFFEDAGIALGATAGAVGLGFLALSKSPYTAKYGENGSDGLDLNKTCTFLNESGPENKAHQDSLQELLIANSLTGLILGAMAGRHLGACLDSLVDAVRNQVYGEAVNNRANQL